MLSVEDEKGSKDLPKEKDKTDKVAAAAVPVAGTDVSGMSLEDGQGGGCYLENVFFFNLEFFVQMYNKRNNKRST